MSDGDEFGVEATAQAMVDAVKASPDWARLNLVIRLGGHVMGTEQGLVAGGMAPDPEATTLARRGAGVGPGRVGAHRTRRTPSRGARVISRPSWVDEAWNGPTAQQNRNEENSR